MCEGPLFYLDRAEEEVLDGNIHAAQEFLNEAEMLTQGYKTDGYAKQQRKVLNLIATAAH